MDYGATEEYGRRTNARVLALMAWLVKLPFGFL